MSDAQQKPGTITDEFGGVHQLAEDGQFLAKGIDIKVDLCEIIDLDLEGFLDMISERAGFGLLMQQEYTVVRHKGNTLTLRVTGDITACLDGD